MEKKIENPVYKTAYRVQSWGDKIEKGVAFTIKYIDSWELNKTLFIPNGKDVPFLVDVRTVVYSKAGADKLLAEQKKEYKAYCQKQVDEYSAKIAALNKVS